MQVKHMRIFSLSRRCLGIKERIIMVSLKNGILKINYTAYERAKRLFEFTFLLNMIVMFAFYDVKNAGPVAAILMFAAACILSVEKSRSSMVIPYISIWYFLLIVYGVLSGLWAQFFTTYSLSFTTKLIIIWMMSTSIAIYVDDMVDLDRIMSLFVAGSLIIVLLECTAVPAYGWQLGSVGSYFSGNNPNDLTIWMDFAAAIAFYRAYVKGKKPMYILVVIFVVFCAFSSSRKGLMAAIAGPMMIVLLSFRKRGYALRLLAAVIMAALIALLVMENETLYGVIGKRFDTMFDFLKGEGEDGSIAVRQYFISVAKEMFQESPLIGKGMGNFALILDSRYAMGKFYSHNNYWQLLSELGLIGCMLYYSMYVFCLIKLLKYYFADGRKASVLFITAIIMMAVLDTGIISYSSKYGQLVIAIIYCATYAIQSDGGRKYGMNKQ